MLWTISLHPRHLGGAFLAGWSRWLGKSPCASQSGSASWFCYWSSCRPSSTERSPSHATYALIECSGVPSHSLRVKGCSRIDSVILGVNGCLVTALDFCGNHQKAKGFCSPLLTASGSAFVVSTHSTRYVQEPVGPECWLVGPARCHLGPLQLLIIFWLISADLYGICSFLYWDCI
jgi:hypothetical protein